MPKGHLDVSKTELWPLVTGVIGYSTQTWSVESLPLCDVINLAQNSH